MKSLFFILFLPISYVTFAQVSWNMTLLSHFQDTHLASIDWQPGNQIWNGCKGWADTINHKEYGIAGSVDSIYFFDITDPSSMKKVVVRNGITHCMNRDFDIYDHYVYCVSDNDFGSVKGRLQIFDMQYLPDSVHQVYLSDSTMLNTHTIFVNIKSKRLYKCICYHRNLAGVYRNALEIYSLLNPENPTYMATLSSDNGFVHECYAKNDTVYCSSGNNGLFFYDMKDTANLKLLGSITPPYPENAYNHSNWLDSSGKYILFTDETPDGKGMKIYDISDIANPKAVCTPFRSYGSPHNSYWVGRYAYTSMYYGGVNIYDMKNVNAPDFVGYFRTFSNPHTANIYEGCWGVYPFLPSGNIIASDMNTGIYLLKLNKTTLGTHSLDNSLIFEDFYPNPFKQKFSIALISSEKESAHLLVYDLHGKIVSDKLLELVVGENNFEITNMQNAPNGLYFIKVISVSGVYHQSIIKQE